MSAEKNFQTTSPGPLRLLALHAQARPAVKELDQVVTILGAGDGADLILGSSRVDAAHTAIVLLPGGTYACDLGAPGGTLLSGRHIRWSRLADGDQLSIGPFSFRVQLEDELYDTAPSVPVFQLRNDQTIGTVAASEAAMVIGSDPCCDIVLSGASISPRHALVVWTRDGMILRDLTGRESVRHNGRPVQMCGLAAGDAIGVGPYELIYETQTSATVVSAAPAAKVMSAPAPPTAAPAREVSPTHWLDESHVELTQTAYEEEVSPVEGDEEFDRYVGEPEAYDDDVVDLEAAPDDYQGQVEEGQEMPVVMTEKRYESRSAPIEQCPPQLKERVAAAQRALDERARKLREELEAERAQIKACQDKLQEQARQLLEVARQKHEESQTQRRERAEEYDEPSSPFQETADAYDDSYDEAPAQPAVQPVAYVPPSRTAWQPDVAVLENIFAGKFDAAAGPKPPESRSNDVSSDRSCRTAPVDDAASLQHRVSELVTMVRDEKQEMYLAENRLESLRFEIDRLRGTVLRAKEKHQVQEAEHEARYNALKRSQAAIRHERESLMTRLRRLDSKDSVLSARVQEAERIRTDLEAESERLSRAQEEHDERLRELRINLEGERHRLRVRQAELQRKAADLAKVARTRRKAVEEIVIKQQTELKEQESELKARRSAVAEAGRAELERAATDLEQLLNARLSDVESEVLTRQENLDNWLKAIWDAAKPITDPTAVGPQASAPASAYKFEPFSSRISATGKKPDGERGHMAVLEKELEGLHRAVRKLEEDSDRRGVWKDTGATATADRPTSTEDRRVDAVFTSKFSEKIASIRKGLIDLGPYEPESSQTSGSASQEKSVGANG